MERTLHKMNSQRNSRITRSYIERIILIFVIVILAIFAGLASFFLVKQFSQFGIGSLDLSAPLFVDNHSDPQGFPDPDTASDIPVAIDAEQQTIKPTLTPWDGAGRVTILILGVDARDWEAGEKYSRSDTMILFTLDPLTKTAGMLSIPRDMWVAIPGFEHGKINTAYFLGDAYKLPGGGPGLAVKTVEHFLGVPINYYAQVDFAAFVRFIDEIGGVKIDVPEKITIDLLGDGPETKKTLKPGVQVLPGEWALAYARNRKTEGGDFDRAGRQQQVILAVRDRILSFDMLPTLISKAPRLFNELSAGIKTNLDLDEAIKLALLAQDVGDENIQRGVIGKGHVLFGRSPDDLSILIPIPDKIHIIRDQIFASSSGLSPNTPGNDRQRMQAENASLGIFNSTQTSQHATRTGEYLSGLGVNVLQTNENGNFQASTKIIDHTGNPYLLKFLVDLMGISPSNIYSDFEPSSPVDVELFLGNDWALDSPIP
jgi:LCP family protein required for cell wall assembly